MTGRSMERVHARTAHSSLLLRYGCQSSTTSVDLAHREPANHTSSASPSGFFSLPFSSSLRRPPPPRRMRLPLRRALSAAAVRRALSTAAAASSSRPQWAMIRQAPPVRSPSPRAFLLLAEPPRHSYLLVPDHLIDRRPAPDSGSNIVGTLGGRVHATSGDGLILVVYMDSHAPAPIVSKIVTGAFPARPRVSDIAGLDLNDPDFMRFVCNPITGELFRLPDIDGTKKTMFRGCDNAGLLTRSAAAGHPGPPDSYAVAVLGEDRNSGTFNMRRFLSRTGKWEKLVGLPSPLPLPRRMAIYTEAVAFAGRLWWADLTWGVVSADPFSDWPELHFIELPRSSVWPVPSTDLVQEQGMHRRLGVSHGRLRYVEMSQKDPFVLSSFALDDDGSGWTLEHEVALGRICQVKGGGPRETPRIAVIDPLNASVIYLIVGKHVLAVDMDMGKVLGCSLADETEGPAYAITSVLKPCVLPPWLSSSKIPAAGTFSHDKGDAKSKTLSDILVRADSDKRREAHKHTTTRMGAPSPHTPLVTTPAADNQAVHETAYARSVPPLRCSTSVNLVHREPATHTSSPGPPPATARRTATPSPCSGNSRTFNMRRFLSRTGKWEKLVGLPSPLPLPRRMAIYTEAVVFAGRLWWADLTWGVVSADPFIDWPELHFVEFPRSSVWPVPSTDLVQEQGMHRHLGVSHGRLRYVEVSQKDPFVLSSFALGDGGSSWTLEHQVALGRICEVKGESPWDTPRIGVLDPLNASIICVIVGNDVVAV
uniref:DUF1618 domain-containing protein n=1 Tax=Oryza punctata TaxID=4537 RepID=A0A0E0L060_ORYPU